MPVVEVTVPAIYTIRYLGRPLRCCRCGQLVDSIQIDLTGQGEHDWIPADEFVCGDHLVPVVVPQYDSTNASVSPEILKQSDDFVPRRHLRSVA